MPEPLEPNNDVTEELSRLRRTVTELLETKKTHKARIAELESANATLTTRSEVAEKARREALIDVPFMKVCDDSSILPDVFRDQLEKRYRVDLNERNELTIKDLEGKPVLDKDGKPFPVSWEGLSRLLCSDETPDGGKTSDTYRVFSRLLIGSKASGGGAGGSGSRPGAPSPNQPKKKPEPTLQLGLR